MDITKFNKELSYKVAKANGLEKNHKLQEAIDIWLEISDMAIQFSKRPNLEFSYKSMLIEKTKQIIAHIKELKAEIIDHKNIIQLVKNHIEINGEKDDIISVVPITDVENLNYTGLKWNVKNLDTVIGWFGISNKFTDGKAVIDFSKGKVLIIRVR